MTQIDREKQARNLYDRYAKPLEQDHAGEFVAVTLDGRTVLATDLRKLISKARTALGPGNFVFKIGDRAVGRWR